MSRRSIVAFVLTCACIAGAAAPAAASAGAPSCARQESHGSGGTAFTLIWSECEGTGDAPRPVVVFLHGFGVTNPGGYEAWIEHLVTRGSVVVFPVYQETLLDEHQVANALLATQRAFEALSTEGHPPIDWSRIAYAGHSGGGGLSLNLAAASSAGIVPRPAVVMPVEGASNLDRAAPGEPDAFGWTPDFRQVPAGTRVLFVVGDDDSFVSDELVRVAWGRLDHLAPGNRAEAVLRTNKLTFPALWGTHLAPLAPAHVNIPLLFEVNAHDRWLWGALDGLLACPAESSVASCLPAPEVVGGRAAVEVGSDDGAALPFTLPPNAGNVAPYVVRDVLVKLRPFCTLLGPGVCGTEPPDAEPRVWPQ